MSSQDGANRSRRTPRTSQQPRRPETPGQRNQTWDVDPAEIDRYLSGRPSRAEQAGNRAPRQSTGGSTADQLSRLRNAVGRGRDAEERGQPTYRPIPQGAPREAYEHEIETVYDEDYAAEEPYEVTPAADYGAYEDEDDAPWDEPAPRRRPARSTSQGTTRQRRPARRSEPGPIDVYAEDDELYNDDPYLGYEDDQIDRRPARAPRPARRPARQRPAMSKPNLPSITLPKSMTDSPLLADMPSLVMIGVAIVSVALMSFLVSDRLHVLGDTIATHVSASGDPENLRTRDAIWRIPLMAAMVALMNVAAAWFISQIDGFAARFLLATSLLVHFIAWVALFKYLWN